MRFWAAALVAVVLAAAGRASATPFVVEFVTDTFGGLSDPAGLLPPGWSDAAGYGGGPPVGFAGSFTYDDGAPDLNPDLRVGEFLFSDPSLTIELSAGGIDYAFQLDRIGFVYSDTAGFNFYVVEGSTTTSPIAGVEHEGIQIFFGNMGPLPSALIPAIDTPTPIAGSPWEDGSGFSFVAVTGSASSTSYEFSKVLGSHGEPRAVVPEPTAALLFAAGLLAVARQRSARRRHRGSA